MATVPSADNNSKLFDIETNFKNIGIYNIIKKERDEHFFDKLEPELAPAPDAETTPEPQPELEPWQEGYIEPEPEDYADPEPEDYTDPELFLQDESIEFYENMMGSSALTKQANDVISSITGEIRFVHEKYANGDCDRDGPTENFWTLYVVVVQDWVIKKLKFYREVYIVQGDKDDEIPYDSYELNRGDNDIFDDIDNQLYPSSIDVVQNTDPSNLGKSAQETIAMVKEEESGHVFFTAEEESYGDCDRDGPLEYCWSLYVFIRYDDTIVRRKFYREFHYRHDDGNMDDVPYEECQMDRRDRKKKFRL